MDVDRSMSSRQSAFRLPESSLHPPAYAFPPDEEGAQINWVLLDWHAYVAERRNNTTAFSETWDGKQIQVTLCLAPPPRVSYLCVLCPGLEHTVFPLEPKILAMEDDVVLIRINATYESDILDYAEYYIYQAADEAPSLKRLARPPSSYRFDSDNVGILRCGTSPHGDTAGDSYIVAALCRARFNIDPTHFVLCLYNSKSPTSWSTHSTSLDEQHRGRFDHVNSKVIAIGGHAGTMGFVDLWRGIIFCDVLKVEPFKDKPCLRYVRLPPPLLPDVSRTGDGRLARDIAVIQHGRTIKYVELEVRWKPCPTFTGHSLRDGWVCRTWSRPVAAECSEDSWELDGVQESSDIPVDSNPHFELLPKMLNHEDMPLEPFKGFLICQPTLSLNDDDDGIVYFTIKKKPMDGKAWVIAVDTKNSTLQGAAEFAAERTVYVNFTYMHSRISKYLTTTPETKRHVSDVAGTM